MRNNSSMLLSILVASFIFSLVSCTKSSFDSEEDLWAYLKVEENGFIQHKNVNGYDFTLVYKPIDLLVQQELREESTAEEILALRAKYGKYLYFSLSMSKGNQELLSTAPKNRNEFGAMVNQLAFGMGEKVHLFTQNKDTIEMADFVYPRMYGMSQSTEILFVFPRDEQHLNNEYLNFTIEDLGLYTGEVKFKISSEIINKEPVLKL